MTSETNEQHRTTMSIGELLAVLRPEFADVTVSKLRFLESAGLVHPERSASGYRQFTEDDVARLRFVLRAQRDQFLPLRVIRQRLEELETSGLLHAQMSARPVTETATADGSTHRDDGSSPGPSSTGGGQRDPSSAPSAAQDDSAVVGAPLSPSSRGNADAAAVEGVPAWTGGVGHQDADLQAGDRQESDRQESDRQESDHQESDGADVVADVGARERHGEASQAAPALDAPMQAGVRSEDGRPAALPFARQDHAAAAVVEAAGSPAARPTHWLSVALDGRLTRDELCRSAHAEASVLTELEAFGLIQEDPTAGREPYREGDRDVLAAAQELAGFGLSARHLRMYKSLVDRESALFAQVVSAQRGRGTPGRQQARRRLERLAELGGGLRDALLANALRDVLGSAGLGSEGEVGTDGESESASLP